MSTSSQNQGGQIIGFDYRSPAKAKVFNRGMSDLLPYGVYAGGKITRVNDTQIQVEPLVCLISSNEQTDLNIAVRIETTSAQLISLASAIGSSYCTTARPYVVLRFGWADVEANYMQIIAVGYSDDPANEDESFIMPRDIIVGKVLFDQPTTGNFIIRSTNPFDYTKRMDVFLPYESSLYNEYAVSACENNSRRVTVKGGVINTSKGQFTTNGGDCPSSSTISDTGSLGRIDLVYVDDEGAVRIEEGVAAANPASPLYKNKRVLAEIRRGANRTSVEGTDIFVVNDPSRQGTIAAEDFPIKDADGNFTVDTIEAALAQLFKQVTSVLAAKGTGSDKSVKDYHVDWGTGTDQVSAGDVPVADVANLLASSTVEAALAELAGAGRTSETLKSLHDLINSVSDALNTLGQTYDNHAAIDLGVLGQNVHGITVLDTIS